MKPLRILATLVLLAATALAQTATEKADYTVSSAGVIQFNDGIGAGMRRFEYIISGGPATASIVLQACMRGGTCATLETSVATTNSTRQVAGVYDYFKITPTFTGGTAPTLQVNMTAIPRGSDAASSTGALGAQVQGTTASGSAAVGNPVRIAGTTPGGNAINIGATVAGGIAVAQSVANADGVSNTAADAIYDAGSGAAPQRVYPSVFNGTTWDRIRGDTSGLTISNINSTLTDGVSNATKSYGTSGGAAIQFQSLPFNFNGATWDRQGYCPNTSLVSVAATTTQIVPLSGSTKVRVCGFILSGNATAGSFEVVYGTGLNCVTGTTSFGLYNVLGAAAPPVSYAGGIAAPLTTPAGQAVCVRATTTTVTGTLIWGQW